MGYVIDILLIAIIALSVYFSVKKGFIRTVMGTVSLLLALILTLAFYEPVKEKITNSGIVDDFKTSVSVKLSEIEKTNEGNFDAESLMDNKPSEFVELLDNFGIDYNELKLQYDNWVSNSVEDIHEKLINAIITPIIDLLASGLAFVGLFIVFFFALKLATFLLDKICTLPILKQANEILGFVAGALNGVLSVLVVSAIIVLLTPYLKTKGIDIDPNDSFVFKFFSNELNIVLNFINGL